MESYLFNISCFFDALRFIKYACDARLLPPDLKGAPQASDGVIHIFTECLHVRRHHELSGHYFDDYDGKLIQYHNILETAIQRLKARSVVLSNRRGPSCCEEGTSPPMKTFSLHARGFRC